MANKPTIYGFCDAGCKWETMHKEDIASSINSAKTELNNNINSAKTELNNNINSAKTELNNNINSAKTELNDDINSVLPNKVYTCKRTYSSSQELDLYDICTINVGEMILYSLVTSSGSIKLAIGNKNMGVTYLALGFNSSGALIKSIIGAFNKSSGSGSVSELLSDDNVSRIYVIAVRIE